MSVKKPSGNRSEKAIQVKTPFNISKFTIRLQKCTLSHAIKINLAEFQNRYQIKIQIKFQCDMCTT